LRRASATNLPRSPTGSIELLRSLFRDPTCASAGHYPTSLARARLRAHRAHGPNLRRRDAGGELWAGVVSLPRGACRCCLVAAAEGDICLEQRAVGERKLRSRERT